jgi:heterodisulfide reductase subunit B2
MNGIPYFPGCSLKDTATEFEASAMFVMDKLGLPLQEFERWNCCGTVTSLTTDDLMHHLASVRNLIRVQDLGKSELVALCAMCYSTLARTALRVNANPEERDKINQFMDRESDYEGSVEVRHLLEVLRDRIGWETVAEAATRSFEGLNVACYYGCTLVRPKEAGIDRSENPTVLDDAMDAVGATPVSFAFATECCGSYQVVDRRDLSVERSSRVVQSAARAGADVIVTACPLCQHNLQDAQQQIPGIADLPVVYFTEILAAAMEMDSQTLPERLTDWIREQPAAQAVEGGA